MYGGTTKIVVEVQLTAPDAERYHEAVDVLSRKLRLCLPNIKIIHSGYGQIASIVRKEVRIEQ